MATLHRRSPGKQPPNNLLNAFFLTMALLSATYFLVASRGDNAHRNNETIPNTSTSIGVFISLYELISVLFTIFLVFLALYFIFSRRPSKVYTTKLCFPATLKHVTSRVAGVNNNTHVHSKCSAQGYHVQDVTKMQKEVEKTTKRSLEGLPNEGFEYDHEMAVGYVQVPVGVVGPLLLDGREFFVPMATTEGCLVASTNRGCKAVFLSGGAYSTVLRDGSTEAPIARFRSAKRAAEVKFYLEDPANFDTIASVFGRYGRLQSIKSGIAGKNLYMRFSCSTGDVTGVDLSTKGVQSVLSYLHSLFPDMDVISISDKKSTAVNWIEGRGKSVVCEAIIKEEVVKKVLKTSVETLVELNTLKNLAGSAVAGSLGGFNAHASNIVTAIYIATGQDPTQNVESSNCITMVEAVNHGKYLHVSVTMPSIEVGTVGGGTQLASQAACLNLLGVKGANKENEGENSRLLAKVIAASVLAGELSLLSAIAAGQLVNSHMKYNRSSKNITMLHSGSSTQ